MATEAEWYDGSTAERAKRPSSKTASDFRVPTGPVGTGVVEHAKYCNSGMLYADMTVDDHMNVLLTRRIDDVTTIIA